MRLAVTADLHWGLSARGDAATRALAHQVVELVPDAFAIAGDVGEGREFGRCLALFAPLDCSRLLVPGNHDLWNRVPSPDFSLQLYERELPRLAREAGFRYLDHEPFLWRRDTSGPEPQPGPPDPGSGDLSGTSSASRLLAGHAEAVLGSINWYDYSFADPALAKEFPDIRERYRRKLFPGGWHNDGRFVRLGMSDGEFTGRLVDVARWQLGNLPATVARVVMIQHHPPVRQLFYPSPLTTLDQRFWLAYTGNRRMQRLVLGEPRITTLLCGHTHAHCSATVRDKRCLNIGGDYDWKRLLLLDTETGAVEWWDFGRDGERNSPPAERV